MEKAKKKKVLAIYRDYLSYMRGTPLRVKNILAEMSSDPEIELYTASRDPDLLFGIKHLVLGIRNHANIKKLNKFVRENKIDMVVYHTISAGYYLPFLSVLNPFVKRVLEMHGFSEEEGKLYGDQSIYKYYRNKFFYFHIYRLSHIITVCSDTAREKLQRVNNNTYTVYGGVDLSKFNQNRKNESKRQTQNEKIVIGYSGNARIWQGLDFLLASFSILVDRDSRFHLHLLLSEKFDRRRIEHFKNVELFEPTSQEGVAKFNAECDILVIPREDNIVNRLSFPSKLMEYLAMGMPVVGSKTSDINRIIKHNESGMLFEPGDTEGLIDCLMQLRDLELRKRIGEEGVKIAEKYSWKNQGKLFVDIIKGKFS